MNGLQAKRTHPTAIYCKPLHAPGAFSYLGYSEGDFPVSEDCAKNAYSAFPCIHT